MRVRVNERVVGESKSEGETRERVDWMKERLVSERLERGCEGE